MKSSVKPQLQQCAKIITLKTTAQTLWCCVLGPRLTPESWIHHRPQASCGSEDTPGLQSAEPSGIKIHPGFCLLWSNQTPQTVWDGFSVFPATEPQILRPHLAPAFSIYNIIKDTLKKKKQLKHWFNQNIFFKVFYPLYVPFSPLDASFNPNWCVLQHFSCVLLPFRCVLCVCLGS